MPGPIPTILTRIFCRQAAKARTGVEIDLTVTYDAYRATATASHDIRTIVFGGKARLSGIWMPDQYVADYVAKHSKALIGFGSVDSTQEGWEQEMRESHEQLGLN